MLSLQDEKCVHSIRLLKNTQIDEIRNENDQRFDSIFAFAHTIESFNVGTFFSRAIAFHTVLLQKEKVVYLLYMRQVQYDTKVDA